MPGIFTQLRIMPLLTRFNKSTDKMKIKAEINKKKNR